MPPFMWNQPRDHWCWRAVTPQAFRQDFFLSCLELSRIRLGIFHMQRQWTMTISPGLKSGFCGSQAIGLQEAITSLLSSASTLTEQFFMEGPLQKCLPPHAQNSKNCNAWICCYVIDENKCEWQETWVAQKNAVSLLRVYYSHTQKLTHTHTHIIFSQKLDENNSSYSFWNGLERCFENGR